MAEDGQQALAQMQVTQQRLQSLDRHLAQLELSMQELQTAASTLTEMDDGEFTSWLPIGGGIRVQAKIEGSSNVLLDLGSGYQVEASVKDALAKIRDRLTNTEAAFRSANDEADKLAGQLQALQAAAAGQFPSSGSA